MRAFRGGSRSLRTGFLALVLFLLEASCRSGACPVPCACHVPTEVHCTFRSLSVMPSGVQPTVKRINLGYNSLTILKEHELSGLGSLELLMLHSNTIQTIEDRAFSDLKALQVLKMSYNRVKELRKETFRGLENLLRVHMDHNTIEFIHPEAFYGLTSLQLVNLEGNIIQQLHPDTFITRRYNQIFKFSSIKTIYLSENALTTLPATVFTGCYQLENLFLSGNPWSCDCQMYWLAAWIERNPGVLKCKRDRMFSGEQMCPICKSPLTSRGSNIIYLSGQAYTCSKPWIHSHSKQRNITMEENSYVPVLPKDFIAPIGVMEMKIRDEYNNDSTISCVVQRPGDLENLNVTQDVIGDGVTTLSATVATSLICNVDYDYIRQLWSIFASYSESPMRLERELLLTTSPEMIYEYKQARSSDSEMFTEIGAEIKANPAWLLQGTINLQLDLTTTTHSTLHIKYLSNFEINIESNKVRRDRFSWTMIRKHNQTKTEFSVLSGGVAELNCETYGDPKPSIEWIFPDGLKVRAPYSTEDHRIVILDNGKLTLRAADSSDTGIYQCIATNYLDADILSFRVTVLSPDVEEEDVNGVQISQTVGGSLVLDCETNSIAQASVQWILPDHTVMDHSFGNRKLYPNGTLAIYPLTERDRGFYRCLAANHLGVDLLISLVTVSSDGSKSVAMANIDGSGDDVQPGIEDSNMLYSEGLSNAVSQESKTITSDRPYPRLRPSPRHGVTTNTRGGIRHPGWSRRVFDKVSRRVDPDRLADFIKRSQNKKSRKDKNGSMNPTDKSQANVGLTGDDEVGSGIVMFEGDVSMPDQAILHTENPEHIYGSATTTYHLLDNDHTKAADITKVLTDELSNVITTTENMRTITTGFNSYIDASPMEPSVSNYEFQKDETTPFITTQGYEVSPSSKFYNSEKSTKTYLQPFTIKFTESMDEMEPQFSGDMPETATEVLPHLNTQSPKVTPMLDRPVQRLNPIVHTSTDPESQTTFTSVTTTEREQDEIRFHTTQKIKSPHLSPGSTIISHQRIRIIPPKKRPGKRRNFFSRRRFIRPKKITDIQSFLDKLKRPSVENESNATVPCTVEPNTDCNNEKERTSIVKTKAKEHSTSEVSTSFVEKAEKLFTTTLSTPFITSSVISSKSTTYKSESQLKSDRSSEYVHSTNIHDQKPTQDQWKEVSTTVATTTTTTKASKVIQGKIPWHRLIGSKEGQREILKRLRKPSKPSVAVKSTTVRTMTTTAPSRVLTSLPTAESMASPVTIVPPVTQRNQGNSGILFDNISGTPKFTESQKSYEVIALITPASPSSKYHKTAVMYMPVTTPVSGSRLFTATPSHITPIPPSLTTTKMTYKEDTVEFSGSGSEGSGRFVGRSWRKRKPGSNRRRFRGRRPVKKSTTQAPTTKSATFETSFFTPQTTPSLTSPLYIPTTDVAKTSIHTSSDMIDADSEEWRKTAKLPNFPKTHSVASEPTQTPSFSYTSNTAMPYITPQSEKQKSKVRLNTNKRISPRKKETHRPVIQRKRPKLINGNLKQPRATDYPDTKRDGSKRRTNTEKTLTLDTVTVQDKITPFPSSSDISNEVTSTYDHTTLSTNSGFETTTKDIDDSKDSKPRIFGGHAASFTVESNSDAFLPCEATGNPEPAIIWKRFSSSTGTTLTIKGKMGKFEVFKNGTLLIQNANVKDQGQYLCLAENTYGSVKLIVMLSVVAYPSRILETKVRDIKAHAGETVGLKCKTEGRPVPVVSWILANRTQVRGQNNVNGRVSITAEGTLVIQQVSVYDRGHYKCIASNPAGIDTVMVHLQVVAAPPGILEEKRQLVRVDVGQSVWMPCTAQGDPQPTTHWVLMDGSVVMPLHTSSRLYSYPNGTLHLKNLDVSDSGKYECIATSSTGSERRVVTLSVEKTEMAPQITETSNRRTELGYGSQLRLNCSATGIPKPRIIWRLPSKALVDQWHRMGSRIQVLENGTLVIGSVSDKDAGDYLCVARSNAGDDLQLMKVSVSMKPAKIEPKFTGKKQVPFGKELKVDCKASGAPIPEISWGLPDGTLVNNALQSDGRRSRSKRYVLFDNGTLFLNKVGMDEEGDYTCYAENSLGKDEMHVHISVVSAAPRIRPSAITYANVKPGGNIRFDCEAIGEPKPKILWMLPSKDMIAASNERYLMHVNGSLDIRNVKLSDAGEYVCIARNAAGDETKVYTLEMDGNPPIINGYYQNRTVIKDTAEKYSRKLIDCKAEGDPPPKITWIMPDNIFISAPYYGSRIIVHHNGTLEIRNVRPTDTAEFICMARNDGGEAVLVIHLEVINQLMRPIFKNPFNERLVTQLGKSTVLNCSADGNPPPDMIWTLPNGTQLTLKPNRGSQHQLGNDGTFVIYNPSKGDAGKYRCAAKNKVGYIEKMIILEVGQKPYILTRPRGIIRSMSGEPLFLHCLADGSPRPNILWTVPGGHVISHSQITGRYKLMDNGTLLIHQTNIHDRGNYICHAKNNVGEAVLTVPVVIVAYPPRITNGPPPNIKTTMGTSVHLNCIATGIPKPKIIWELPDRSVLSTAGKGLSAGSDLLHPQGTLIIQKPTRAQSGLYKCLATNPLGTDTRITYMTVI